MALYSEDICCDTFLAKIFFEIFFNVFNIKAIKVFYTYTICIKGYELLSTYTHQGLLRNPHPSYLCYYTILILQSGKFLSRFLGPLLKVSLPLMKNVQSVYKMKDIVKIVKSFEHYGLLTKRP